MNKKSLSPSEIVYKGYKKIENKLNNITIFYTKEKISCLLNSDKFHYTKYLGKSKNRTMINDDPVLYKSLLHHTSFIEENKYYGLKHVPLSMRLLIAGEHNFIVTPSMYCRCGKRISFNHANFSFDKLYCENCLLPRNSKEHFKFKYGDKWEYYYIQNSKKYINCGYRLGFSRINTSLKKHGKIYCPNIGYNEKKLLDEREKFDNCIIDRNYKVLCFFPDGYCHETNTIYEIFEPFHKYQYDRDLIRLKMIKENINCNFNIIYDGWDGTYLHGKKIDNEI